MATVLVEDFESGTSGAALDAANTSFTDFFGDTAEFTDVQAVDGVLAADFSAAGSPCDAAATFVNTGLYFRRFYFWIGNIPGSNSFIHTLNLSGANRGDMRIEPDGHLSIRNGYVKVWTSAQPLTVDAWNRVELKWDSTGQVQACRLFAGGNLHGTIPDDDSGDVAFDTGTFDTGRVGNTTANTLTLYVDAVADDDADWVGPLDIGGGGPPVDPPADVVFSEDFESGIDGAALSSANTSFAEIQGTPRFTANQPVEGSLAADFSVTTEQLRANTVVATPVLYFRRMYFRLTALPAQFFLASINLATAARADIRVGGSGILAVRDQWTAKWSADRTVTIGDWNRLEWGIDIPNTRQQLRLFYGDDRHAQEPTLTSGWVDYTTGDWNTLGIGCLTNTPDVGLQIDAVMDSVTDWVGPLAGTTPPFDATHFLIEETGLVPCKFELIT